MFFLGVVRDVATGNRRRGGEGRKRAGLEGDGGLPYTLA
jgi:hypothetical protein